MSTSPYFTIVTPVFNRHREIRRAMDSCLAQSFSDFEVIVVDDGSSDHTADVVAAEQDPRVHLIRHPQNRGVCPARNTAVRSARGSWIVFLDSDDELLPGCLERIEQVIRSSIPDIDRFGFRFRTDDGRLSPTPLPPSHTMGYLDWVRWIDDVQLSDTLWATRRTCFDDCMLPETTVSEFSYCLDFARRYRYRVLDEVLAVVHSDAQVRLTSQMPAAKRFDAQTSAFDRVADWHHVLSKHGDTLRQHAPRRYQAVLRNASMSHTLAGHRWKGVCDGLACLRFNVYSPINWISLLLALAGPRVTLWTSQLRAWHRLRAGRNHVACN